jgi:dihydrodipicolinate synthase/N-acetylneuraminate lyase
MIKIQGVIVPLVTPKKDNAVDKEGLKNLINLMIDNRVDGIFILGTTGEFQYMTQDQRKEVIITAVKEAKSRTQILVGVTTYTTDETLELVDFAKKQEADAIVLAPMFYPDPAKTLEAVSKKTILPIVLYNNPEIHNNTSIPFDLIKRYASSHFKVTGIKDSSGDWDYFKKLLSLSSKNFQVLQGNEDIIIQSLNNGATGIVPGTGNITPDLFKELWDNRDPSTMYKIDEIKKEIKINPNYIYCLKKKLVSMGMIGSDEIFKKMLDK